MFPGILTRGIFGNRVHPLFSFFPPPTGACCGAKQADDRVPSGVVYSEGALGEGSKGWGLASSLQTDLVCEQVVVE